jgi:hypothetical protein
VQIRGTRLHEAHVAGENYPLIQRSGKVLGSIEPAMDLYNSPSIECPPKNLMVDSIFFRLRSTNYFKPARERADAFRVECSRHRSVRKRRHILNRCTLRVAQQLHNRVQTEVFCTKVGQFTRTKSFLPNTRLWNREIAKPFSVENSGGQFDLMSLEKFL